MLVVFAILVGGAACLSPLPRGRRDPGNVNAEWDGALCRPIDDEPADAA